jgi:hypothetical protein
MIFDEYRGRGGEMVTNRKKQQDEANTDATTSQPAT